MNGLNIIFKIKESNFFENKILSKRDKIDIDKILVSKKNHMIQKSLNTSFDIMMMMIMMMMMVPLDHYV